MAGQLGRQVSRNTLRTLLKQAGLSWKKCKKLLTRGQPEQRAKFVEDFQQLYTRMCQEEVVVVYLDEVHVHPDMELGYTWSPVGGSRASPNDEPAWVPSTSPGLSARLNWYGAYNFTEGQCLLWQDGQCNGDNTIQFLQQLAHWLAGEQRPVFLIWDGASYHRSQPVRTVATQLGFHLFPLPAYTPDLNPIEGLWKWLREEVTQLHCYPSLNALLLACQAFLDSINQNPLQIISRLWPRFDLDPELEELRFSS